MFARSSIQRSIVRQRLVLFVPRPPQISCMTYYYRSLIRQSDYYHRYNYALSDSRSIYPDHRRRKFHSLIWNWFLNTLSTITTACSVEHTRLTKQTIENNADTSTTIKMLETNEENDGEETIEELNYRYSMINAHPLGPWQAILIEVQRHYSNFHLHQKHDSDITRKSNKNHDKDVDEYNKSTSTQNGNQNIYTILDVGCGPRGQPGTTIANALPNAFIHCIDSCTQAINSIPTTSIVNQHTFIHSIQSTTSHSRRTRLTDLVKPFTFIETALPSPPLPQLSSLQMSLMYPQVIPPNLIKSVCNMDHLSTQFIPNSINVIVSCFGYGSSKDRDNIQSSLRQAYETLLPGGILILCTWQYSSLLALSRDIRTTLQHGCGDSASMILLQNQDHMDDGTIRSSHPGSTRYPTIQYSNTNEWEDLLYRAGFQIPNQIQSTTHAYPICLGTTTQEQLNFGTFLIPIDVQEYYNCMSNSYFNYGTSPTTSTATLSGYRNTMEEAFWMNISEHIHKQIVTTMTDDDESTRYSYTTVTNKTNDNKRTADTSMWMPKNIFKITVSTK